MEQRKSNKKITIIIVAIIAMLFTAGLTAFVALRDFYTIRYFPPSSFYEYRFIVKGAYVVMEKRDHHPYIDYSYDGNLVESRNIGYQQELRHLFDPIFSEAAPIENVLTIYDSEDERFVSVDDESFWVTQECLDFIRKLANEYK